MKLGVLKSIGHNVADSLASGIGMMIGVYDMDVFREAAAAPEAYLEVDFLTGSISGGSVSPDLADAVKLYSQALPALCVRHGAEISDYRQLTARFSGHGFSRRVTVTVEDRRDRRSTDEYVGLPGQRKKVLDHLGRIRRK